MSDPSQSTIYRRIALREELVRHYGDGGRGGAARLARRLRFWRKRWAWHLVVGGTRQVKRLADILVSATALVALLPLFVAIALAIRLTDRGPVLFWQTRVGRWGREFACPKFRSMVANADRMKDALLHLNDHGGGTTFKMRRDPRVTSIGRVLRKLSLDELPQLWCVLNGTMSLVGPRPPVPREVARYNLAERRRLDAVPGLTCIWQISGRGDLPFDRQVELDVQYIQSQSLWLDLVILLKTIPAVLTARGAY